MSNCIKYSYLHSRIAKLTFLKYIFKMSKHNCNTFYSHSVVPGGFGVRSYNTLDIPGIS